MPLKLSPRDMMIAVGVGAALVLVLFLIFAIRPKLTELAQVRAGQKVEADRLEQNKMKLKRLDAIRREAAEIEAQRIELARRMPKDAELPSFIIDLQRTANDADLDLIDLKLDDPEEQAGYKSIPFQLKADASFYTMVDFLYRVEEMKRDVVIDELSLKSSSYPILNVDIKGRTFMVIEKKASAAQPDAGGTGGTPAAAAGAAPASPAPQ